MLEEFCECEVKGVSLFSKGPNAVIQSSWGQEANDLSAAAFHIGGLPAALALGRTAIEQQVEEWSEDASGLCSLMQRTIGGGVQLALPCLLEDAQHAPLLAKLQDTSVCKTAPNAARLMQSWAIVFKTANRVAGRVLFGAELFSELGGVVRLSHGCVLHLQGCVHGLRRARPSRAQCYARRRPAFSSGQSYGGVARV